MRAGETRTAVTGAAGTASGPNVARVFASAREAARLVWATWKAIVGADKYEKYVAHHSRVHPGHEPMGEKEFWKRHYEEASRNPQARCC